MMEALLILLFVYGAYSQRMEFTDIMGQCEDLMCNRTLTCELEDTHCAGRPCKRAKCVPIIEKSGSCGIYTSKAFLDCDGIAEFLPNCYEDNHCRGAEKCCAWRCGFKECRSPYRTSTFVTNKPVVRRPTQVLLLAGDRRRNNNQALVTRNNRYIKQGICPVTKSSWINSLCSFMANRISTCTSDRDCSGDRKCCPGRCNLQECTMAVFPTNTSSSNTSLRVNMTTSVTPTTQPPVAVPSVIIPKPSNVKPGQCPAEDQNWQFLCGYLSGRINSCLADVSCPEVQKCCPGRCNLKECKTPLLSRADSTAVFVNDRPDLVTDRPDPVQSRTKVASCPQLTTTTGQPYKAGAKPSLVDLLVCSLIYTNNLTCRQHTDCAGSAMCCRTRCDDFRCVDPVYT